MDIKQAHLGLDLAYDRPLLRCRFSPDGKFLVTSSEDFTLQRWNLDSSEKVILKGHESWVHALQFAADGSQLVSGGCDGRLIWWSIAEAAPASTRVIDAHEGWIRAISLSPDGTQLASVGNDRMIRVWSMESGEKLAEWLGHDKHIYSVLFDPDGKHLLTGGLEGKLQLWDLQSKQAVRSFDAAALHTYEGGQRVDFGGVRSIALSPDRTQLLAGGLHKATNPLGAVHEPLVLRFQFSDGQLLKSHVCDGIPGGVVWRVLSLPDATTMAVCGGSSGGFLLFFTSEQEKDVHRFKLPALARDMDYHPASQRVATVHHDHHLRITHLHAKASS
jgi:hypothetical protein